MCGIEFEPGPVLVSAATDSRFEIGYLCGPCVAFFGERKQAEAVDHDWPTYAEYLEAKRRYPEPMFASGEEPETPGGPGTFWIHQDRAPLVG